MASPTRTHYALPDPSTSRPWTSVHPRALPTDFAPPPSQPELPSLPSPPRQPSKEILSRYDFSTHIVPAASPRTTRAETVPDFAPLAADFSLPKDARAARAQETLDWFMKMHREAAREEKDPDTRLLWNVVNRFVRKDIASRRGSGLTMICFNANGLHKETWEPTIAHMISRKGEMIDEIWAFEPVNHGDSGLINAEHLSAFFDWMDQSRDVLSFLLHYLPPQATKDLPIHLPRLPSEVSTSRMFEGYASRSLVALGHSWGGTTCLRAALACPALFSSIVLIDPVIVPCFYDRSKYVNRLARGAITRRWKWQSREEARRLLRASPFFGRWNPEVLDLYVEFAMRESPDGPGVELKMPGLVEASVFAGNRLPFEIWELLPCLDNRIALHWIIPGDGALIAGTHEATADTVWRRKTNASNVIIPTAGHLITQEAPKELATEIDDFLHTRYGSGSKARL